MYYTFVKQHDMTDCAAACISMISKHYGLKLPIMKIRQAATTDTSGTNILGIKKASEDLGFDCKAYKGTRENLNKDLKFPFIAHTQKDGLLHYVVVHAIKKDKIIVGDPARGIVKYTLDEFGEFWSGVLIFLHPNETFKKGNETEGLFSRFFYIVKPHVGLLIHISIASIILTLFGLVGAYYYKYLIDDILANFLPNMLIVFTIGMVLLNIFKIFLNGFRSYMMSHMGKLISSDLILKYYQHVISLPMNFFESFRTGEIISRLGDASKIVETITGVMLTLMIDILMVIFAGVLLVKQNIKMFFLILLLIPIQVIFAILWIKPFQKRYRENMENYAQTNSYMVESISGVAGIKSLNGEEETNYKLEEKYIKSIEGNFKTGVLANVVNTLENFVNNLSSNLLLFIGGMEVIKGNMSVGQLMSFTALFSYFFDPIKNLIDIIPNIQEAYIASERLGSILDLQSEKAMDRNKINLKKIKGNIEVKNLTFKYGTREDVLKNLSFKIMSGEKVAIVGESGSGKSTFIKVFMKYFEEMEGEILFDGYNLQDIGVESLRKIIAYVPQDVFLFSGTIKENLEFGFGNKPMEEIIDACKRAQAHDFISKMPLRYNTLVGENGSTLSGGQKQRLALARAILSKSDLLIFDEATSSLDSKTERLIQITIDEITKDRTAIIIAHRLSTIMNCDKIIVLDKGEVVEIGKHSELIQKDRGVYKNYWEMQIGEGRDR